MSSGLFVISDAHLGAQSPEKEEKKRILLNSFLEHVLHGSDELLICGDLFDFWFEYKWAIPKLHFRTLVLLAEIVRTGREIHYLAGNHDFWLGDFFRHEIGIHVHEDDYEFHFREKRIYCCHGDGIYKKDHLYRALKKVLRNPVSIWLYRLIHPDIGIPLALHFSHESRESKADMSSYSDMDYREFAYKKIDQGYDYVILGHTHWPAVDRYAGGYYLNPGNWLSDFSYLYLTDGPAVFRWDGNKGVELEIAFPPGQERN